MQSSHLTLKPTHNNTCALDYFHRCDLSQESEWFAGSTWPLSYERFVLCVTKDYHQIQPCAHAVPDHLDLLTVLGLFCQALQQHRQPIMANFEAYAVLIPTAQVMANAIPAGNQPALQESKLVPNAFRLFDG